MGFSGVFAYVTTVAGEWFFDYTNRPIDLHHRNSDWKSMNNSTYHLQKAQVFSPLSAITYIYRHDNAEIRREMKKDGLVYIPFLRDQSVNTDNEKQALSH